MILLNRLSSSFVESARVSVRSRVFIPSRLFSQAPSPSPPPSPSSTSTSRKPDVPSIGVIPWLCIDGRWYFVCQQSTSFFLGDLKCDPFRSMTEGETQQQTATRALNKESMMLFSLRPDHFMPGRAEFDQNLKLFHLRIEFDPEAQQLLRALASEPSASSSSSSTSPPLSAPSTSPPLLAGSSTLSILSRALNTAFSRNAVHVRAHSLLPPSVHSEVMGLWLVPCSASYHADTTSFTTARPRLASQLKLMLNAIGRGSHGDAFVNRLPPPLMLSKLVHADERTKDVISFGCVKL